MLNQAPEHPTAPPDAPAPADEPLGDQAGKNGPDPMAGPTGRLVPVTEAIKYRRRAQQAEARLQEYEQRLNELQAQLEGRLEELATAEAQRDEVQHTLNVARLRQQAERMLHEAGVGDVETAMALLEARNGLSEELDPEQLRVAVQGLLQSKPFLIAAPPALPGKTASARPPRAGANVRLAQAAARAANTGSRRELAEYLRLRRQSNVST